MASQVFAACDTFDNLISGEESGLMGLGWQSLCEDSLRTLGGRRS